MESVEGRVARNLSERAAARLAWSGLACSLLLVLAGVGLRLFGPRPEPTPSGARWW